MIRSRAVAWAALLATLFSAASPTLAALVLWDRPAALGQMLGIPAAAFEAHGSPHQDGHADHGVSHSGDAADAHDDEGSHQAHSIHCSLCLNPSSLATIAAVPPSLRLLGLEFDVGPPQPQPTHSAPSYPLYHSRAPPA